MIFEISVPDLGDLGDLGDMALRYVYCKEGDYVKKDEFLFEISGEKYNFELPMPQDGWIIEIALPEGCSVKSGDVVVVASTEGDEAAVESLRRKEASTRTGDEGGRAPIRFPPGSKGISSQEILGAAKAFYSDYPMECTTALIIMPFDTGHTYDEIHRVIVETLRAHGIQGLRADDKEYADDLLLNVRTYMICCSFGIALFDRLETDDLNPNVSLEVGYMMGLGKSMMLLKEKSLRMLQSDLAGKLYKEFSIHDIEGTLPEVIEKWLRDKHLI